MAVWRPGDRGCFKMVFFYQIVATIVLSLYQCDVVVGQYDAYGITHGRCEPITIPLCQDVPYNMTIMPNLMNHQKQEDAGLEVHQFYPLVKVQCAEDLKYFLCSMYAPVCTVIESALPPCKSLCLSARNGCEGLMNKFGFSWPESLECAKFPEEGLCFDRNRTNSKITLPTTKTPNTTIPVTTALTKEHEFVCPPQLSVDKPEYEFLGAKNCAAPCNQFFNSSKEQRFASIWIGSWAFVCLGSSLFTVLTFMIDRERFKYPERPIIFLSGCYVVIALVYIVGFFQGDEVACKAPPPHIEGVEPQVNKEWILVQGSKKESPGCIALFMLLYYFRMASSIWWVLLSFTWFLAAGLKWGHEAIERNSHYFHFAAWAIPAIKTIVIIGMSEFDGDSISGVCYTGISSLQSLRGFVIAPLFFYLVVGSIFLASGFIALFRIRTFMKADGNKTDKLEKLMMRIGLFSVLYTLPATVVIGCYFYEQSNRIHWDRTWQIENCNKYPFTCPNKGLPISASEPMMVPDFLVFMIKYLMLLVVGITSGVWIWSGKTMRSWTNFFARVCHWDWVPKQAPTSV